MLFNSFAYLLFFPSVALLYYLIAPKYRWLFLLVCSYYFYMNWKPIYALLIFASTAITYFGALRVAKAKSTKAKRNYLYASLVSNLGILFLFKYYNFFNESVFSILDLMGIRIMLPHFDLLLPVGISFYTFQSIGYIVDVYREKIQPETHFGKYALFISFFPQLVAGPIERSASLLPQLNKIAVFDYDKAIEGLKLIIWGYYMKVVVADRLAIYVDAVYNNSEQHGSITLIMATILFSFQIYCDFAGYSNIAIGSARIMGIDLVTNFKRPYFARSISDFWKRWHISLSTWLKDYVYIPLGGNRVGKGRNYFNLMATFLISGLWHGANWTFVIWGALNGVYQVFYKMLVLKTDNNAVVGHRAKILLNIGLTFVLVCFSRIFFRADSLDDAVMIIKRIFSFEGSIFFGEMSSLVFSLFAIFTLLVKDYIDERNIGFALSTTSGYQYSLYTAMVVTILLIGVFDGSQFIYFQF